MKNLYKALAEAQKDVQALARDGANTHHRYRYTTSEAVIDEARKCLAEHGLAFVCRSAKLEGSSLLKTSYLLTHESGDYVEISSQTPIVLAAKAEPDKRVAAAKTYDLAYTLRSLLLIPRSDEIAVDQREPHPETASNSQTQSPAPTKDQLLALKLELEEKCEGYQPTIESGLKWAKEVPGDVLNRMMHAIEVAPLMRQIDVYSLDKEIAPPGADWAMRPEMLETILQEMKERT